MKNYSHIVSKLFYEPLLITPMRHAALLSIIESRLGGAKIYDDGPSGNPAPSSDDDDEVQRQGSTAIIPVHGTLVMHNSDIAFSECGCSMEDLGAAIDAAENDPRIETMIFDFRSPGGGVYGVPEVGRKILHSRKNTIGFTSSECCSGALWIAAQCGHFYATGSSRVGSCGVYCMTLDMSKSMDQEGIKVNAIFAGKYKLLGASFKPLEDDERQLLQSGVDKIYKEFCAAMESYRMVADENFGNGRVFDGAEAAAIGFTDGVVEDFQEVLDMME